MLAPAEEKAVFEDEDEKENEDDLCVFRLFFPSGKFGTSGALIPRTRGRCNDLWKLAFGRILILLAQIRIQTSSGTSDVYENSHYSTFSHLRGYGESGHVGPSR
jgi:hypothetical protein